MPGFDLLVSSNLSKVIKNQLDSTIKKKLERELFFQNGMSIKLSIENFDVFLKILKKYSSGDPKTFVENCFSKVFKTKKSESNYILTIIDQDLSEKVCDYFGDPESRSIMSCIMGCQSTVPEILKISKVLKSPGYRKIENLILDGLLLESGKILSQNKRISQYTCVFDKVLVEIKKDKLTFEGTVNRKIFNESSIIKSGFLIN